MTFALPKSSEDRLHGVHPDLVRVVRKAAAISAAAFIVIEGLRTKERQAQLYAQGRTAPGKVVTWTMDSKHLPQADGYGHAVDVAPILPNLTIPWGDAAKFDALAKTMFEAAKAENVKIVWGADWNHNGRPREAGETDSPHFQLA